VKKPISILVLLLLITATFIAGKMGAQPSSTKKEKEPGVRLKLEAKKVVVKNQRLEGLTLIADGITFDISGMPPEPEIAGPAGPTISITGPITNAVRAPETVTVNGQVITRLIMQGDGKEKAALEVKRQKLLIVQATADEIVVETPSEPKPAEEE
jgi:hypothetical protein